MLGFPGETTVYGVAGPSSQQSPQGEPEVYAQLTTPVTVGSYLDVVCTLYGQNANVGSLGTSNLWDYTAAGWFNNATLQTGSATPIANACTGNVSAPTESNDPPSATLGPYPIYNNGSVVSVLADATTSSLPRDQLNDGDLVTLVCTATGQDVSAPTYLTGEPIGHSAQWDVISYPANGWVPDALVNSANANSPAPPC